MADEPKPKGAEPPEKPWSEYVDKLARSLTSEAAAALAQLRSARSGDRNTRQPGAADRYAGAVEKLGRAANSFAVLAERMRESEKAMAEHEEKVTKAQAEQLAAIVRGTFDDLGIDLRGEATRAVLRHRLIEHEEPPEDQPVAAHAEVRAAILSTTTRPSWSSEPSADPRARAACPARAAAEASRQGRGRARGALGAR